MVWVYYLLLFALDLGGIVLVMLTLPGLWLMLGAAAVYALLTHGQFLGWRTLIVLLVLTVGSELGELYLGGAEAKKAGASRAGMVGGVIGAILGGIFLTALLPVFAPLNAVLGICLGSFVGAFGVEMLLGQNLMASIKIGFGAAKGRLFGIVGKVAVALFMLLLTLWTAFPHVHAAPPARPWPATLPATVPVLQQ